MYTNRRIKDKQSSIERLVLMLDELEKHVCKRKKECHATSLVYNMARIDMAHTLKFYTEREELAIRASSEVPLFHNSDTLYIIISHLFTQPLRFDLGDTSLAYRPSYTNRESMRALCNLTRTCHFMNDIIGPVLRKNRPIVTPYCIKCAGEHTQCSRCKTKYCYPCDTGHYPRYKCQHNECNQVNLICPCYRDANSIVEIRCQKCPTKIHHCLFT